MNEITYYVNIIKKSLNKITQDYYRIKTTYAKDGIVRERVFCYELYHQIRANEDKKCYLKIHGEIDKRGHEYFHKEDRKNPDFIFHTPGKFKNNTIIMEVKGNLNGNICEDKKTKRLYYKGIFKDLDTIYNFVNKYEYKKGILLLYNHNLEEFKNFINSRHRGFFNNKAWDNIIILIKKDYKSECIEIELNALIGSLR